MENRALWNQLNEMIAAQIGIPVEEVTRGYGGYGHNFANLGADEYDMVSLFMALSTEFSIGFPDEDIETLDTPDALYRYMLNKTQG